jgi:hypothetical protein|tara:strand:+ start:1714 stop:2160 length:447 start_codon:yes stop_codon:yes gene_type:complete
MNKDLQNLITDVYDARAGQFEQLLFGYLGEVNGMRGTKYPLLVMLPPSSSYTDPYSNDEKYTCVFHCYDFNADALDNSKDMTTGLAFTLDNLKEKFKATIQALVKNNEDKYILSGGWQIERVSREFNDNAVGIVCTIEISAFTDCLLY